MSGLFKVDTPDPKTPPSKDDERARQLALEGKKPKGGRQTTMLTDGLSFPALAPAGSGSKPTMITG